MKTFCPRSVRRMTAAAIVIVFVGLGVIKPRQVIAQEAETPETARFHSSPPGQPAASSAEKGTVEVRVDNAGHYTYAGHVMGLDEIVARLKNAAAGNPSASIAVQVTPEVPFRRLVALFDKLNEVGISQVSLVTLTQGEAYCHLTPTRSSVSAKPDVFNVDFGVAPSRQTGPAAAGREGDFWNAVSVAWSNDHTESDLKFASGEPSAIQVRMINLGGGWGSDGRMGVKAPMLDSYNYPVNNQGGNAQVILKNVPPTTYDIYIYGHEADPLAYGDYTLTVGNHQYGRKTTSNKKDAIENTTWVEGSQYVKYNRIEIGLGEDVNILIQPGGQVTDHWGRTFSDAVICGLQLIPVR